MNEITLCYIKNGLYIPFIHVFLYCITNNLFLSTIITLKMYPFNYFFWFSSFYEYKNIPKNLYFIKQFVRFTDTGHIASFIYFLNPIFFPIAYNVHFIITFAYWTGKICFKIEDKDELNTIENIKIIENAWSYSNHFIPLLLLVRELWINSNLCNYNIFIFKDLYFSYLWLYTWFFCIYMPWKLITKDYVYNIFSPKTSIKYKIYTILFMHILILIANTSGKVIHNIHCY